MLEPICYKRGKLSLLDQLLLPSRFEYADISDAKDGWEAIHSMKVRGAPAIAISAALSLAVEAFRHRNEYETPQAAVDFLSERLKFLTSSRPTAVNLFRAASQLTELVRKVADEAVQAGKTGKEGAEQVIDSYIEAAEKMLEEDLAANRALGKHGANYILEHYAKNGETRILTHCNTGSLATAGYGTALGVIRSLFEQQKLKLAYCTETRPYNQGARLTALELVHDKIPATLITDSMAGFLMQKHGVDAVVVGADRVAANGDTANKIGTYALAVLCQYHSIPFFIASPTTTLDPALSDGSKIPIEERPARELTHINGVPLAAEGIGVWNPAFDVTPHNLITGIITEKGMITKPSPSSPFDIPAFLEALKKAQ